MNFYKAATQATTEKLKELKTWAQVKSPKTLQPALSYALDWLAPELLGTGFRMVELNDYSVKAFVPARTTNFDFQKEVHQGLVLNAGLELARSFLQKQMSESVFQISTSQAHLNKKLKWNQDLEIVLEADASDMDDFFIDLQKNKKADVTFHVTVHVQGQSKTDSLKLSLQIKKIELIA
ncbi:MAG: hypothetical protein K2P92_08305 [Bdellovibrionaceae bacterium]|nr:hypothetical protein [Pseudobdellovibrionaceae bacterium]